MKARREENKKTWRCLASDPLSFLKFWVFQIPNEISGKKNLWKIGSWMAADEFVANDKTNV